MVKGISLTSWCELLLETHFYKKRTTEYFSYLHLLEKELGAGVKGWPCLLSCSVNSSPYPSKPSWSQSTCFLKLFPATPFPIVHLVSPQHGKGTQKEWHPKSQRKVLSRRDNEPAWSITEVEQDRDTKESIMSGIYRKPSAWPLRKTWTVWHSLGCGRLVSTVGRMKDKGGKRGREQGREVEGKEGGSLAFVACNLLTLPSWRPLASWVQTSPCCVWAHASPSSSNEPSVWGRDTPVSHRTGPPTPPRWRGTEYTIIDLRMISGDWESYKVNSGSVSCSRIPQASLYLDGSLPVCFLRPTLHTNRFAMEKAQ